MGGWLAFSRLEQTVRIDIQMLGRCWKWGGALDLLIRPFAWPGEAPWVGRSCPEAAASYNPTCPPKRTVGVGGGPYSVFAN